LFFPSSITSGLKRHVVVDCFRRCSVLEYAFVDPDKFDGVEQNLECCVVIAFLVRPLALVKNAGNSDAVSLLEIFAAYFRQLIERDYPDPAGFLFRGLKSDVKGRNGHSVRRKVDLGIVSQVPGYYRLV